MSVHSVLGALSPRSPRHVLEDLAVRGQRAAAAGQERPVAVLELASGRQVQGRCLAVSDDAGLAMVLLHTGGNERTPQVMQVRVDHIVAVGYDLAGQPAADREPPGRLEISRALSAAGEDLARALGGKLELVLADLSDDAERLAAMALVPVLRQALLKLAADALGQEALRGLSAVRVGVSTRRGVVKAGGALHIDAAAASPTAEDDWTVGDLVTEIERAL